MRPRTPITYSPEPVLYTEEYYVGRKSYQKPKSFDF